MPTDKSDPSARTPSEALTCQQVTDAIVDYLTGDMQPETTAVFDHHLQGCPDCFAFFNTYNSTVRTTRSLSYDDVPNEVRRRVQQFLLNTISGK